MKYCSNCGNEVNKNAAVCLSCGTAIKQSVVTGDAPNGGYAVLGFFVPIIGLILWLIWQDTYPLRAKSAGKGVLINVILNVVFLVIIFLIQLANTVL